MNRVLQQPPAREAGSADAPGTASRSISLGYLVLPTILAVTGVKYVILRNGAWVYDDNLILSLARSIGFGWTWLNHPIFQHWDPGMNATYSVLVHLFPLDYRWALLAMLLALGVSMFFFERIIGMVIGRGWVSLALCAWFGFSITSIRQLQWWASGVQAIPSLLCEVICLYGFLRFFSDRRDRWIVLSAGALAVGLLFYEKPALMLVYLALTRTLLMAERFDVPSAGRTLWRERRLWLPYCAVLVAWGIGYLGSGAYGTAHHGSVTVSQYLNYFRIMWLNALVPALAGFTVPASPLSTLQTVAVVASQLAILALLVNSLRRKPSAWRAWAFIGITFALEGAVVAQARVPGFGVGIAADIRYLTDFTWLIPFALCCAFSRERVLRPRPDGSGTVRLRVPSVLPLAIGALLIGYCAASLATVGHLQTRWGSVDARHWEAKVQRSFGALARRDIRPVVADNTVPFKIISSTFAPDNRLSRVLPLYVPGAKVDGPLDGPLAIVDAEGHAHLARIRQSTGGAGGASLHLLRAGRPVLPSGRAGSAAGLCVAASNLGAEFEQTLPRGAIGPGPYYLDLGYSASQPLALQVLADTGAGYSAAYQDPAIVTRSAHSSLTLIAAGLPRRLKLVVPPHAGLCVRRMAVVNLAVT